jgi:hypothetical protein
MKTWTATATAAAPPAAVLAVLTDPEACTRWAPVPFDVEGGRPQLAGSSARVSGRLAGRLLAEATNALLSAGALDNALSRLTREAALSA